MQVGNVVFPMDSEVSFVDDLGQSQPPNQAMAEKVMSKDNDQHCIGQGQTNGTPHHSTTSCLPQSLTLESSGTPQTGMARHLSAAVAHSAPNIGKRKMPLSAAQRSGSKPSSSAGQNFSHRTSIVEIRQMAAFAEGHRSPPPRTTPAEPLWPSNLNQQL